jgi:hypothetical protein
LASSDTSYHAWFLLGAASVLLASAILRIDGHGHVVVPGLGLSLPETCWYKRLTGHGCPGCGLTRSFVCLSHGQWRSAWRFNPSGLLFYGLVAAQIPYRVWQIRRHRRRLPPWRWGGRLSSAVACLLAAGVLGQWIWRWVSGA